MSKKTAFITGASRGIGKELAKQLANDYTDLVLLSRNKQALEQLKLDIGAKCRVHLLVKDLSDLAFADDIPGILEDLDLQIDAFVHNAGALISKPFEDLTMEEVTKMYQVNVLCLFPLLQSLKVRLKKEGSNLVFISSMGGVGGSSKFPGLSSYSSSKGALIVLAECLAEEWKELGHRINNLALGAVQTEMLSEAFPGYEAPIDAQGMAKFVSWFLQNGGAYMNGKTIPVALSTP